MTQDQPPLTVRAATASEAAALARLFEDIEAQTITTAYVLERLNALQDLETPLLAEQDGEILGMASLRLLPSLSGNAPHAEVSELYVKHSRSGDQVERALIDHIEQLAKERGAVHINLLTGQKNMAAQELYRSLGYQDYALVMRKYLSA